MVIIIGWNLIYNNNNKFITILSCIAIVIIVFCLISHINLLYEMEQITRLMLLLEKDMDKIIIDTNKIINKSTSVDWDFLSIMVVFLSILYSLAENEVNA